MDRKKSSSRSPRRKHKKHRYRPSKRSRSRSRSRSRTPPRIHVNPAFGTPNFGLVPSSSSQMGYSASQLLNHNNQLEAEVARLTSALRAEQANTQIQLQRNATLAQEIRNITSQRDAALNRANEVINERRMMVDMKTEMANRIHGLEVANRQHREDAAAVNQQFEAKNQEIRGLMYQSEIVQQQISALNERNAALKAKCESTVAHNRQLQEELDSKRQFVENAKLNVQKAETDLHLADMEIQRLLRDLENHKQSESMSISAKISLSDVLQRKEDEIQVARFKAAGALRNANEKIEKLENQLKREKPAVHDEMTVFQETIYSVIETIKKTYETQLSRLEEEVEALRTDRLKDHQHEPSGEQKEQEHQMEELPEYLQTPMKPDPRKMNGLMRTNQVRIPTSTTEEVEMPPRPSSGPPVDSPMTWHHRKAAAHNLITPIPLFGTTGHDPLGPSTSSDLVVESGDSLLVVEHDDEKNKEPEVIDITDKNDDLKISVPLQRELTEEDLLLGEPTDPSVLSPTLELTEKQLLDEF